MFKLKFTTVGGSRQYWEMDSNYLPLTNELITREVDDVTTKYKVVKVSRYVEDVTEHFVVEVQIII